MPAEECPLVACARGWLFRSATPVASLDDEALVFGSDDIKTIFSLKTPAPRAVEKGVEVFHDTIREMPLRFSLPRSGISHILYHGRPGVMLVAEETDAECIEVHVPHDLQQTFVCMLDRDSSFTLSAGSAPANHPADEVQRTYPQVGTVSRHGRHIVSTPQLRLAKIVLKVPPRTMLMKRGAQPRRVNMRTVFVG